jgi:hypothetical protein
VAAWSDASGIRARANSTAGRGTWSRSCSAERQGSRKTARVAVKPCRKAWGAQTRSSRRGFVFVEQSAEEVAPSDLKRVNGRRGQRIGSVAAIRRSQVERSVRTLLVEVAARRGPSAGCAPVGSSMPCPDWSCRRRTRPCASRSRRRTARTTAAATRCRRPISRFFGVIRPVQR